MTKVFMFNPYTGTPRHPSDITSDPEGLLLLEPDAPVRPAQPEQQAEPVAWMYVKKSNGYKATTTKRMNGELNGADEYTEHALYLHPPAQPQPVGHIMRTGRRADGKPWVDASFKQDGSSDLPDGTPLFAHPPAQPTKEKP